MKKVRFWAVLAIGLMSVTSMKAQSQRMLEFQNEFSKYQTQYRDLLYSGKHKEAIAPLVSCIAMPDTTRNATTLYGHSGTCSSVLFPAS